MKNVAVVTNQTGKVMNVFIFDYGSHRKFKNVQAVWECTHIAQVFDIVRTNFENNWKVTPLSHRKQKSDKLVIGHPDEQAYYPDVNLLKSIKLRQQISPTTVSRLSSHSSNRLRNSMT